MTQLINDGFGESSDQEDSLTEILDSFTPWLKTVTYNSLQSNPGHPDFDDVMQEARIAMWRAALKHDPSKSPLNFWLKRAALNRIKELLAQRLPFLGEVVSREQASGDARGVQARDKIRNVLRVQPNATGAQIAKETGMAQATVSYHRKRLGIDVEEPSKVSFDALLDAGWDLAGADTSLDYVLNAYHRGIIAQSLDVLTPNERKYVVLKFWQGKTPEEITAEFGYSPHAVWRLAKAKLAQALVGSEV